MIDVKVIAARIFKLYTIIINFIIMINKSPIRKEEIDERMRDFDDLKVPKILALFYSIGLR